MALVVGLDIGTRSLTGAVFTGTAKKARLIDFFREEIPTLDSGKPALGPAGKDKDDGGAPASEAPAEYVAPLSLEELIQKTLSERNLKAADVVVALDAKDCVIREFPVAFTRSDQIAKVVPFEAENYLPTLNLEDIILEYLKVGEKGGKSQILLLGMRQDLVESRLAMLKRVEVDPVAVDLDATALFNAFAATPVFQPAKSTLLIDMGATSTKIVLIEGGALKKVRAFRSAPRAVSPDRMLAAAAAGTGGASATASADIFAGYSLEARFQEIENALKRLEPTVFGDSDSPDDLESTPIAILSDEDFDRMQELERAAAGADAHRSAGATASPPAEPAAEGARLRSYLERLGLEIQRTLAMASTPVELLVLTGGLSGREDACRYFSEEFDVETIQLDFGSAGDSFPAESGIRMDEVSRYGAVAVGLALKELGHDKTGIDFRKGRFRYEHRFTRLQYPLLALSVMAFAFFLQTAFWAWHDYESQTNRGMLFDQQAREAYKEFFSKEVAAGRDPLAAAREQQNRWKGKGGGDVGRVIPALDAVRDFAQTLNGAGLGHFQLMGMNFNFRVKAGRVGGKVTGGLRDEGSSAVLNTTDSQAHLTLERKFQGSKWWGAKASSKKVKDEYKIDLKLEAKPTALKELE